MSVKGKFLHRKQINCCLWPRIGMGIHCKWGWEMLGVMEMKHSKTRL